MYRFNQVQARGVTTVDIIDDASQNTARTQEL